ncbi:NAD-dependent epimerase/dehydratase family protein [Pygmaiobacter massiliensis]|uniref:NAD-dependent epimerase/dehydratase family protein n=1 Tax=Pygmaiobacter massiliensis TaxID=1917873 RepID=UPI00289E110D|nr:NAD(P)-dependent oxidoreductase [Pygmaiobacter massiliensis]
MNKAIVTGATGMLGSALCYELLSQGNQVLAVVRPHSKNMEHLPSSPNLQIVECELNDISRLPTIVTEHDWNILYHLAWSEAFGTGRNNVSVQLANLQAAQACVCAAAEMGCKAFLGAGSQAEYGRAEGRLNASTPTFPENAYGIAKLCAGQLTRVQAHQLGMKHVWVRILSTYGPLDNPKTLVSSALRAYMAGEEPELTPGEQQWDYLYSADAARALRLAGEKGVNGAIYPIGSGSARPLKEYILAIRDAVDATLPSGIGKRRYATGQVMHLEADISALTKDTGFVPQISFEEGIYNMIEYQRNHSMRKSGL